MIDSVPLIQNANDAQQINASIIALKKASRELDEKIAQFNKLLSQEITNREKAITEAINSLDVPSVGGSGKYISAISETDGKINATASDLATSVQSGNSQPVTSGGVASAMNNPIIHDFPSFDANNRIFHLGTFNSPNNDNYNGAVVELEMFRADRVSKIIAVVSNGRIELLSLTAETLDTYQSEIRLYKTSERVYDLYLLAKSWTQNNFIKITSMRYFTYDGSLVSSYIGTQVIPSRILSTYDDTDTVASGNNKLVTSNAVATSLESYLKCVKAYSVTSSTLDISDLPRGLYLCVFNNLYSSYERFNIGILCNWIMSQNAIKYTTIASDGITVSVNGSIITTNQIRIYGARFYRIGYARGTSDS